MSSTAENSTNKCVSVHFGQKTVCHSLYGGVGCWERPPKEMKAILVAPFPQMSFFMSMNFHEPTGNVCKCCSIMQIYAGVPHILAKTGGIWQIETNEMSWKTRPVCAKILLIAAMWHKQPQYVVIGMYETFLPWKILTAASSVANNYRSTQCSSFS